jgi:hypothetical protein
MTNTFEVIETRKLRDLGEKLQAEHERIKKAIQPIIDRQEEMKKACQPLINMQEKLKKAFQPMIDRQENMNKACQPIIKDLQKVQEVMERAGEQIISQLQLAKLLDVPMIKSPRLMLEIQEIEIDYTEVQKPKKIGFV